MENNINEKYIRIIYNILEKELGIFDDKIFVNVDGIRVTYSIKYGIKNHDILLIYFHPSNAILAHNGTDYDIEIFIDTMLMYVIKKTYCLLAQHEWDYFMLKGSTLISPYIKKELRILESKRILNG